jgi:hypothetical protein
VLDEISVRDAADELAQPCHAQFRRQSLKPGAVVAVPSDDVGYIGELGAQLSGSRRMTVSWPLYRSLALIWPTVRSTRLPWRP